MSFLNLLSYGYAERSLCYLGLSHCVLDLWALKWLSLCLDLCGSLVDTLSGHYQVHQLAPQFVFASVRILSWYLEWTLSSLPGYDCGSTACDLRIFAFSWMSGPWLVSWVDSTRFARMWLWPLCCENFLCESWIDLS